MLAAVGIFVIVFFVHTRRIHDRAARSSEPIRIVFVGDIMMDRGVRTNVHRHGNNDYGTLFEHTAYLYDSDIAFGNLEGPVGTGGRRAGSKFSFRMDTASLTALRNAGFDIVSFANNHVGDYSRDAFMESLRHLQENNILYTGAGETYAQASAPTISTVRGTRVGFLGVSDVGPNWLVATERTPGILLASDPRLSEIIAIAKSQTDILIVSFHWGMEYSPANARQEKLAHSAIDAGADIVLGHHPHVMQKVETYKNKPIFYSLGNFIFDQYFSLQTMRGMVAEVSIDPETLAIGHREYVSELSRRFVPQEIVPFNESFLITKAFHP